MTPVINEIVEEVITSLDAVETIIDYEHFKLWIEWQRKDMRFDHQLRFDLSNFSLYSKNPEIYWPYIEKALGLKP